MDLHGIQLGGSHVHLRHAVQHGGVLWRGQRYPASGDPWQSNTGTHPPQGGGGGGHHPEVTERGRGTTEADPKAGW